VWAFLLANALAQQPVNGSSTVTLRLGGGWLANTHRYNTEDGNVRDLTYEYRFGRWPIRFNRP